MKIAAQNPNSTTCSIVLLFNFTVSASNHILLRFGLNKIPALTSHSVTEWLSTSMCRCINVWTHKLHNSPRLLHPAGVAPAHIVGNVASWAVDLRVIRVAQVEKVWSHAPHGHLCDVRERLTHCAAEDEHAYLPVKGGDVRVSHKGKWTLIQISDPIALANHNL